LHSWFKWSTHHQTSSCIYVFICDAILDMILLLSDATCVPVHLSIQCYHDLFRCPQWPGDVKVSLLWTHIFSSPVKLLNTLCDALVQSYNDHLTGPVGSQDKVWRPLNYSIKWPLTTSMLSNWIGLNV
jgi:hypothetical protein